MLIGTIDFHLTICSASALLIILYLIASFNGLLYWPDWTAVLIICTTSFTRVSLSSLDPLFSKIPITSNRFLTLAAAPCPPLLLTLISFPSLDVKILSYNPSFLA